MFQHYVDSRRTSLTCCWNAKTFCTISLIDKTTSAYWESFTFYFDIKGGWLFGCSQHWLWTSTSVRWTEISHSRGGFDETNSRSGETMLLVSTNDTLIFPNTFSKEYGWWSNSLTAKSFDCNHQNNEFQSRTFYIGSNLACLWHKSTQIDMLISVSLPKKERKYNS